MRGASLIDHLQYDGVSSLTFLEQDCQAQPWSTLWRIDEQELCCQIPSLLPCQSVHSHNQHHVSSLSIAFSELWSLSTRTAPPQFSNWRRDWNVCRPNRWECLQSSQLFSLPDVKKTWWQRINNQGVCIFLKDNLFQLRWWYKNANIFNTIQTCVGGGKEKVHLDNQSSASPKLELIILLSSVIGNSSSPNLSPLWRDKSNEVLIRFCSTNI